MVTAGGMKLVFREGGIQSGLDEIVSANSKEVMPICMMQCAML